MATPPLLSNNTLLPSEDQGEEEENDSIPRLPLDYNDFISTLPLEKGWVPISLRKYQGFWIPTIFFQGILAVRQYFKARPDDLFITSHPKSGTTWLKALIFATRTRGQCPLLASNHPLLSLNPHDCIHFLEGDFAQGLASRIQALPSPRIIATHMPYSLLPDAVRGSDCRFVHVCRDPKDVLVSFWHFTEKMRPAEPLPFGKAFELFSKGASSYGPVWDHALEYWRESLRRPEKVLFLKYEEMMADPAGNLRRLAEFMGCPFSPEEEKEGGVVEEIIRLCSFDNLSKLEANKGGSRQPTVHVTNDSYFRKAEVGDWMNHLSTEMAQRLDEVTQQKLRGSGLSLGSAGSPA